MEHQIYFQRTAVFIEYQKYNVEIFHVPWNILLIDKYIKYALLKS